MNLLLVFISLLFNGIAESCECESYHSLLDQSIRSEVVLIGEVVSFENPYSLPNDIPKTPDAPNRYSAVIIKVVELIKGEVKEKNIKVFGYAYYSDSISDDQPFRLGFEYVKKGSNILFCLGKEEMNGDDNSKAIEYGLTCCGTSLLVIDNNKNVAGKIESPETITTKPLDWIVSKIKQ